MKRRVVGIVGVGAIGGSIGMRARRDGALVVGYDCDAGALAEAIELGAIDFAATREELYARAGTVAIAAHLDATLEELRRLRDEGPLRATLILDVASVKSPVVETAGDLAAFVATHPMAGSHRAGVRAASPTAFDGKTWAYVPSRDPAAVDRARAFVRSLGAVPVAVDAAAHDRIVAFTSHLPQIVAGCYASAARRRRDETFDALLGSAARELLRLGESGFAMWRPILAANATAVSADLATLASALSAAAEALAAGRVDGLRTAFPVDKSRFDGAQGP